MPGGGHGQRASCIIPAARANAARVAGIRTMLACALMAIELHSCTQANTASAQSATVAAAIAAPAGAITSPADGTAAPTDGTAAPTDGNGTATGANGTATGANGAATTDPAADTLPADETWNATQPKFEAFLKGVFGERTAKNRLDNGAEGCPVSSTIVL